MERLTYDGVDLDLTCVLSHFSHGWNVSVTQLEAEALKLAPEDQARLLHRLALALDSVEESELTNEELEKRWADFEKSGSNGVDATALHERAQRRYGLS
jgi:hypothetical protein